MPEMAAAAMTSPSDNEGPTDGESHGAKYGQLDNSDGCGIKFASQKSTQSGRSLVDDNDNSQSYRDNENDTQGDHPGCNTIDN